MRHLLLLGAVSCSLFTAATANAAPGLGSEVYGATVEKGETEFEVQYDRLTGGPENGEDVVTFEAAYGVSNRLRLGVKAEFEREVGSSRKAEELAVEAIYRLGTAGGIDFAVYGEYALAPHGADKIETKLLIQRRSGPWDLRLNLIAEKQLMQGEKVELGYAASADVAVAPRLRLGVMAFGELGTFSEFAPNAEHFIGPSAKFRLIVSDPDGDGDDHGGLSLSTGYLFALGTARQETKGQFRLKLEYEF